MDLSEPQMNDAQFIMNELRKATPSVSLTRELSAKQHEWRNHPSITAFTRQNGLISDADMGRWYEKIQTDPTIQMFGIKTDAGQITGTCGLTSISHVHGSAEFSLLIGPEYHRRGYGRAALIELLKYGFKNLRLNCIWWETFEGNPARTLFKELGMMEEGKCRQRYFKNGAYVDSYIISILRSDAEQQTWWS
jgi:RimJ/RimL family protein N-acetyltransferase